MAENRRARFDYEILETFEAGIELRGFEVKAVKSGRVNLAGSFALPRAHSTSSGQATSRGDAEIWLLNCDIPPYQPKNTPHDYDPKRSRRLLLKKAEIKYLLGSITSRGLRLIPIKIYTKNNRIKLELGLGKAKRQIDKRESLKKKEIKREIARNLKKIR